jgi:hypothetical protein
MYLRHTGSEDVLSCLTVQHSSGLPAPPASWQGPWQAACRASSSPNACSRCIAVHSKQQ